MIDTIAWMVVAAVLVPAHRAALRQPRTVLATLLALEVAAVGLIAIAKLSSTSWSSIAQEDGAIEWATFVAFVMAAGWLVFVVRRRSPSRLFQAATLLLALFCLVVAGEEISWGQRIVGFKPPDVFLEQNFQQELNVHNILMDECGLGFRIESKHLVMAIVLGFGLAFPLIVRSRRFAVLAPLAPPWCLAPVVLGVVAAEMSYPVELTGEGAELIVGLVFLASALLSSDVRPRTAVVGLVTPLVLGMLISIGMARVVFGSDEEGVRVATAELELLAADAAEGATAKLAAKNVHKRLFTATRAGYVALAGGTYLEGRGTPAQPTAAAPRTDRRGYFLDPWNNPYWVHFDRRSRTGAIYSFGPNRRRDVAIRDAHSDPGDDVIVRFALAPSTDLSRR